MEWFLFGVVLGHLIFWYIIYPWLEKRAAIDYDRRRVIEIEEEDRRRVAGIEKMNRRNSKGQWSEPT